MFYTFWAKTDRTCNVWTTEKKEMCKSSVLNDTLNLGFIPGTTAVLKTSDYLYTPSNLTSEIPIAYLALKNIKYASNGSLSNAIKEPMVPWRILPIMVVTDVQV